MNLFSVENGAFKRGNRVIFSDISCEVKNGEILAVLGCNGAGKTTFIQCCMGLLKWSIGKSMLEGKDIAKIAHKDLFSQIAYIPQAKNLNIALSVLDMVLLGCNSLVRFTPTKEHIERVKMTLERIGIAHLQDKRCDNLSGGELQMVIFARALVNEPKMIILDEPESNLDFKNQHKVLEILEQLRDEGKGIIINTHYLQHIKYLADKILILHKNRAHIFGDKTLLNKAQLSDSFEVSGEFFSYLMAM